MSKTIKLAVLLALSLIVTWGLSTVSAYADDWNKATKITFSNPVEIPGMILPAGTYMFKILDLLGDRHVVRIFNEDESAVYATILAFADWRPEATDDTVVTFYESEKGRVPALHEWFYPGHLGGVEFAYPEKPPFIETAAVAEEPIVTKAPEAPLVFREKPERAPAIKEAIKPPPPEVVPVEETTIPEPEPEPEAPPLPKTATSFPLIGLIGLLAAGAASGLGWVRR
jgi:hypothetical protein